MSQNQTVGDRFAQSEAAFAKKMADIKKRLEALNAQHLTHIVFESLMESAKAGRLSQPERVDAAACKDCGGACQVVRRGEDRSVMFGDGPVIGYDYIVCHACCTAREAVGSRSDADGIHYS